MPRSLTLKDHFLETRLFGNRAIILLVFCGLLLAVLFTRLLYLQVIEHEHYITLSEDNRVKLQAIAPNRGLIYDREGVLLAGNKTVYEVDIDLSAVVDPAAIAMATSSSVGPITSRWSGLALVMTE